MRQSSALRRVFAPNSCAVAFVNKKTEIVDAPQVRAATQKEDAHYRVMRVIAANPHFSQRDIAAALGVSLGSVNYCLNALFGVGFVKAKNFRAADNKLRYAYFVTPKGFLQKSRLAGAFLKRKMREYEMLKAEIESLKAESVNAPQETGG